MSNACGNWLVSIVAAGEDTNQTSAISWVKKIKLKRKKIYCIDNMSRGIINILMSGYYRAIGKESLK